MSPTDHELESQLRDLFADDRLAVHSRVGAEGEIVAGARRLRRRRTMLTSGVGVVAAVALVGTGVALSGVTPTHEADVPPPVAARQPERPTSSAALLTTDAPPPITGHAVPVPRQSPPVTEQSTERPPAPSSSLPAVPTPESIVPQTPMLAPLAVTVLRPDGFGRLTLGMPYAEAAETGLLGAAGDTPPTECTSYRLAQERGVSTVSISPDTGIVRFVATTARTPEGVGAGSTVEQLRSAYPQAEPAPPGWTVPAGDSAGYRFSVGEDGVVTAVQLVADGAPC